MRRGIVQCGAAALLFGASTPFAAQLAREMNPFTLAGLLYLGAALAVIPGSLRYRPDVASIRRGRGRLTLAVVLGGAVGPVLLAMGLKHTPAASASLLLNLELVFTVVLAAVVFREHIGQRVAVGAGLVAIASAVVGWSGSTPDFRIGALLIAAACVCWAIDNGVTADLDELAPAHITLAKGLVAGGANTLIGLSVSPLPSLPVIGAGLLIGVFGYGISITMWVAGARDLGAARAQVVFATAPFLGAIVAWTVFGDVVTATAVVALVVAAIGAGLVTRSDHGHLHTHPTLQHDHEHVHEDSHHDHEHADSVGGRHQHPHTHTAVEHTHAHVPDLHHRHDH
ncbi:MAG: DMT family transporter [Cellulomonas sp.]